MKTGYAVSDVMTQSPITVGPDTKVEKCASEMKKNKVSTLIIKEDKELVGVVSEKDIIRKVIAEGKNPIGMPVRDIMVTSIITIEPDKDMHDALRKMRDMDVRHLPVIHNGELVGLLTMKDALKIEPQLFELMVEKIRLREESRKPITSIGEDEGICELCGEYSSKLISNEGSFVCEKCIENVRK